MRRFWLIIGFSIFLFAGALIYYESVSDRSIVRFLPFVDELHRSFVPQSMRAEWQHRVAKYNSTMNLIPGESFADVVPSEDGTSFGDGSMIALVSFFVGRVPFARQSDDRKLEYARLHNYAFFSEGESVFDRSRPPAWSKVCFLLRFLYCMCSRDFRTRFLLCICFLE